MAEHGHPTDRIDDRYGRAELSRRSTRMKKQRKPPIRVMVTLCAGGLNLLALAGCTTGEEIDHPAWRRCSEDRQQDGCMYMQHDRRNRERLMNQDKALINAEQARENLRMLREMRRKRGEY
jgi:hypothetical protein